MELFPAADDEQFEFIKSIIDQSDYYIVISAGRYGSVHPETGLSYTEMEFDYAVEKKIAIIALIHSDLGSIAASNTEGTDAGKLALGNFHKKLKEGRIIRTWRNPVELGAAVITGLQWAKTHRPATGWVRADRVSSDEARIEIADLQKRVAELELQIERARRQIDVEEILSRLTEEIMLTFVEEEQINKVLVNYRNLAELLLVSCLDNRYGDDIRNNTIILLQEEYSSGHNEYSGATIDAEQREMLAYKIAFLMNYLESEKTNTIVH